MKTTDVLPNPSIVQRIATLEDGWVSAADVAWTLADEESYEARSVIKTALGDLYRAGYLERMFVRHRDQPLACYKIDRAALRRALAEVDG